MRIANRHEDRKKDQSSEDDHCSDDDEELRSGSLYGNPIFQAHTLIVSTPMTSITDVMSTPP